MKVLVTGATGFVGHFVLKELQSRGHDIAVLTRNSETAANRLPVDCEVHSWEPCSAPPTCAAFEGASAVIHLAGENIASGRWTKTRKRKILNSRVLSTRRLVEALGRLSDGPRVLVSSSAIGYYGDGGNQTLTEDDSAGEDFLADVCKKWEQEVFEAKLHGVRAVALRTGVVLGRGGGAMQKMLPIFRLGMGGRLGTGKQWMSWIHAMDLARMFVHAIETPAMEGAYNATSPFPVTQQDFTATLAGVLKRPARFPVPAFALKMAFGDMAGIFLASQRVLPKKLLAAGFEFSLAGLKEALEDINHSPYVHFERQQWIPQPIDKAFSFFREAKNLETLTPDYLHFKIVGQSTEEIKEGTKIDYRLRLHGLPFRWQSQITDWQPVSRFADVQTRGPYAYWHHTHEFIEKKGGTLLQDRVMYKVPFGVPGELIVGGLIRKDLEYIFAYRRQQIERIFGTGKQVANPEPKATSC
jgi:uncharacterized protein (TIGR01777 family)